MGHNSLDFQDCFSRDATEYSQPGVESAAADGTPGIDALYVPIVLQGRSKCRTANIALSGL